MKNDMTHEDQVDMIIDNLLDNKWTFIYDMLKYDIGGFIHLVKTDSDAIIISNAICGFKPETNIYTCESRAYVYEAKSKFCINCLKELESNPSRYGFIVTTPENNPTQITIQTL